MHGISKRSPHDRSPTQIRGSHLSCTLSGFPGANSKLNPRPNAWPWIPLGAFVHYGGSQMTSLKVLFQAIFHLFQVHLLLVW
jgi:hypothetical protein